MYRARCPSLTDGKPVSSLHPGRRVLLEGKAKGRSPAKEPWLDSSGETYEYAVSEIFVVKPSADWVIDPVRDRDMVTLQTCTYNTLFSNRIVVRADRV
jgi:hypothetical protein